jgi:hypothetical protein
MNELGTIPNSAIVGVSYVGATASNPTRNSDTFALLDGMDLVIPGTGTRRVLLAFSGSFSCGATGWVGVSASANGGSTFFSSTAVARRFTVGEMSQIVSFVGWMDGSAAQRTVGVYWATSGLVTAEWQRRVFCAFRY